MNIEDKFSKHVKSIFDEYEDGTADQGWAELLKKYPERYPAPIKVHKSASIQLWISGIAASILVACFILFYATEKSEKQPETKTTIAKDGGHKPALPATTTRSNGAQVKAADVHSEPNTEITIPTQELAQAPAIQTIEVPAQQVEPVKPAPPVQESAIQTAIATTSPISESAQSPVKAPETLKDPVPFSEFLANESRAAVENPSKEKKQKGTTSLDIYAGTFFNYFDDNPAQLNAGFGLNANVKLSKKIYLSVGAGLSENKIAYENSLPRGALDAFTSSFPLNKSNELSGAVNSPIGGSTGAVGATGPAGPGAPNVSFASRTSGPSTDVKINATLLNLDIPIALKFYAGKEERFYILTGINSNSYINQRYMQSYSTFNYLSQTTEVSEQEVEGSKLSGFDFANSAIFAVGFSHDLGKRNTLTFEPFYRPSLKGLGDKNIRLNTIGLNLKLNLKNK